MSHGVQPTSGDVASGDVLSLAGSQAPSPASLDCLTSAPSALACDFKGVSRIRVGVSVDRVQKPPRAFAVGRRGAGSASVPPEPGLASCLALADRRRGSDNLPVPTGAPEGRLRRPAFGALLSRESTSRAACQGVTL